MDNNKTNQITATIMGPGGKKEVKQVNETELKDIINSLFPGVPVTAVEAARECDKHNLVYDNDEANTATDMDKKIEGFMKEDFPERILPYLVKGTNATCDLDQIDNLNRSDVEYVRAVSEKTGDTKAYARYIKNRHQFISTYIDCNYRSALEAIQFAVINELAKQFDLSSLSFQVTYPYTNNNGITNIANELAIRVPVRYIMITAAETGGSCIFDVNVMDAINNQIGIACNIIYPNIVSTLLNYNVYMNTCKKMNMDIEYMSYVRAANGAAAVAANMIRNMMIPTISNMINDAFIAADEKISLSDLCISYDDRFSDDRFRENNPQVITRAQAEKNKSNDSYSYVEAFGNREIY